MCGFCVSLRIKVKVLHAPWPAGVYNVVGFTIRYDTNYLCFPSVPTGAGSGVTVYTSLC